MHIQNSALKYSQAISSILDVDVVIIDRDYNKIAYTARNVSDSLPITRTSVIGEVMNTGEILIIEDKKNYSICKECFDIKECLVTGMISVPIFLNSEIIGAVGLLISKYKDNNIFNDIEPAIDFVQSMADLFSSKLKNVEDNEKLKLLKYERETIINNVEDGLIFFTNDGKVSYYNNMFLKYFNIKKEIYGLSFDEIFNHPKLSKIYELPYDESAKSFYYQNRNHNFLGMVSKKTISVNGQNHGILFIFDSIRNSYNIMEKALDGDVDTSFNSIETKDEKFIEEIEKAKELAIKNEHLLISSEEGLEIYRLSRAIHNFSNRSFENFKEIECKDKSINRLEKEIFGINCDTGSNELTMGVIHFMNEGTVLLRNINEMPMYLQEKLLEIIKTKIYNDRILGEIKVNIRFIFHSTRELQSLVEKKLFNEELNYRVYKNKIVIPPIRERDKDIDYIIKKTIEKLKIKCKKPDLEFDKDVLEILRSYSWPGNIYKIEKQIEFLVSNSKSNFIKVEDVKKYEFYQNRGSNIYNIEEIEKKIIQKMIDEDVYKNEIAEKMGISRATLYRKLKKYDLE